MEIKQLKYFVEVARREHISDAALELNIAQSAVSRQITQLEKELNVTLLKEVVGISSSPPRERNSCLKLLKFSNKWTTRFNYLNSKLLQINGRFILVMKKATFHK